MSEDITSPNAAKLLKSFIDRIQRLDEEKKEVGEQIKEVKNEAKANGFDVKTINTVLALCKKDADTITEEASMLEVYLEALGLSHLKG